MIQQSQSQYTDLVLYTDKTVIQKDTGTSMFIAALVTVNKVWKQPKCPSTDEWIKKNVVYTYSEILFSIMKR